MEFTHPTKYRFYIQKYPVKLTSGAMQPRPIKEDIEALYQCRFMKFEGMSFDGAVKNTYTESYAESSGDRVWVPDEVALSSKECTLKLFFKGGDVEARSRNFYEKFRGVKVEYSDTFRNRYVSLIMDKEPKVEYQKLCGDTSLMVVTYTFTNFLGYSYTESKI